MRTERQTAPAPWDWPDARERCLREARRYTRSAAEAEDIVQEALLRAWRTRTKLRNTSYPLPWLLQITRNEALRSLSRSGRERERSVLVAAPEAEPAADEWTEAAATRMDVDAALRQLPEDDRAIVNLRYRDELTHSTIAELMNMPVGTCKVRLHRLRKRLRVLLAEEVPA
ncbi:MAG TPA: sigma-70 family RNA polymerase sigma factor [Solirubrobacteraceae bacterium]|nr:sigma-70 family RNA polymerase sigma factor [Solirubrobacteraceae bacterium]